MGKTTLSDGPSNANDEEDKTATARPNAGDNDVPPSSAAACAWLCTQAHAAEAAARPPQAAGQPGSPNGFDHDGLIFSAIAVGFDTLYQRQTRFGAQLHVLQALEQL